MSILNSIVGFIVDALLYPFRELPPIVGLCVVSIITAVGMLLIFKRTSDQQGLESVKRQIHAGMFEIRLFSDDPRAILRAEAEILRHTLSYLRLTLVPTLLMIVPLVLLLIQLQFHYGYSGLEPGSPAIVKVRFKAGSVDPKPEEGGAESDQRSQGSSFETTTPSVRLEAPSGLRVESALLWIPSLAEADWRVAVEQPGNYRLMIHAGEQSLQKTLIVSSSVVQLSPVRPSGALLDQLLYPVEPPLPDGPVESIVVSYPEADVSLLGWDTHWLVAFFIITIVAAFALRRPLRVTI